MVFSFRNKLFFWLLAFSGTTAILFSSLLLAKLSNQALETPRRIAKSTVAQAANFIPPADVLAILHLPPDLARNHPAYLSLRQKLLQIPMAAARVQGSSLAPDDDWGEAWLMVRTHNPATGRFLVTIAPEETGLDYDMTRFPALIEGFSAVTADPEPSRDEFGDTLTAYAPIIGPDGRAIAVLGFDIPARHIALSQRTAIVATALSFAAVFLASWLVASFASQRITRPLDAITAGVDRISRDDLETPISIPPRRDELGTLVTHFNAMLGILRERHLLRRTLVVAASVQRHLLPETMPRIPGLDIAGDCAFCDETGGDYYDVIPTGDDSLLCAIGDVSGHGVPAALMMASARGVLRSHASLASVDLPAALHAVDRHVARDMPMGNFMTMLVATLSPLASGGFRLSYVSAGHEPILLLRSPSSLVPEFACTAASASDIDPIPDFCPNPPPTDPLPPPQHLESTGLPLGVDDSIIHDDPEPIDLFPGDIAVLLTDGVRECFSPSKEEYGLERVVQLVQAHRNQPAADIVAALLADLNRHHASPIHTDDVTALVIKLV